MGILCRADWILLEEINDDRDDATIPLMGVVIFVWKARPEIIKSVSSSAPVGSISMRKVTIGFLAAALVTGGVLSWFASTNPDGLEWAIFKAAGTEDLNTPAEDLRTALSNVQEKTALLPDY